MANTAQLDILLTAKNQASSEIRKIKSDLGDLDKSAGLITKGMAGFAAGVGLMGIAQLAGVGLEMARVGAMTDQLRTAYNNLAQSAGESGESMLAAMRKAARGSITDADLMLAANRAMLLGVADSADEMAALLSVAEARGKAMGLSATQAFGDLVTGIGRMSPLILDNLGIVTNGEQVFADYAASVGKAASALSDAEKKQALLNAVIASSKDIVDANNIAGENMVDKFERMDAAISNAKSALGELFAPAVAVVAQSIADAAQAAADGMQAMAAPAATSVAAITQQLERQLALLDPTSLAWIEVAKVYNDIRSSDMATSMQGINAALSGNVISAEAARDATMDWVMAQDEADAAALTTAASVRYLGLEATLAAEQFEAAAARTRNGVRQLQGIASGMVDNLGAAGTKNWLDEQNAGLRMYQQYWRDVAGYSDEYIDNVLTPSYLNSLREGANELDRQVTSVGRMAAAVPQVSKAFQDMQSKVGSVLSGALDTGTGVDPNNILEAMGFREDAINENARRLADIAVNGLKNQDWLGEFQSEAPDIWNMIRMASNPQEEAALLLRDFQNGLRPDLIDKGRAKELVKAMILGDQKMNELGKEIATELAAEMGIPLSEALGAAQSALGTGGAAQMGEGAADQFGQGAVDALAGQDKGGLLVDTFLGQIKSSYADITAAAIDAGTLWANGFMTGAENISARTVTLLVNLVTPGVMSNLATQKSLTEPVN
jgi:hypothetical protein